VTVGGGVEVDPFLTGYHNVSKFYGLGLRPQTGTSEMRRVLVNTTKVTNLLGFVPSPNQLPIANVEITLAEEDVEEVVLARLGLPVVE